eukprot:scaffold1104_cov299-Prasinococcus_capsulatus_cf.AAC.7
MTAQSSGWWPWRRPTSRCWAVGLSGPRPPRPRRRPSPATCAPPGRPGPPRSSARRADAATAHNTRRQRRQRREACASGKGGAGALTSSPSFFSAARISSICCVAPASALPSLVSRRSVASLARSCSGCCSAKSLMICGPRAASAHARTHRTSTTAAQRSPSVTSAAHLRRLERVGHRRLDGQLHAADLVHERHVAVGHPPLREAATRDETGPCGGGARGPKVRPVGAYQAGLELLELLQRLLLGLRILLLLQVLPRARQFAMPSAAQGQGPRRPEGRWRRGPQPDLLVVLQVLQLREQAGQLLLQVLPQLRCLALAPPRHLVRGEDGGGVAPAADAPPPSCADVPNSAPAHARPSTSGGWPRRACPSIRLVAGPAACTRRGAHAARRWCGARVGQRAS